MRHDPRTVVYLARECRGFVDVGGVKDVAAGLAAAAAQAGIETHLFIPYHRVAYRAAGPPESHEPAVRLDLPMDYPSERRTEKAAIYSISHPNGFRLHLVDGPRIRSFVDQDPEVPRSSVFTYTLEEARALGQPDLAGRGHLDYFALNVLFQKAVIHGLGRLGIRPELIHCHDGHAALVPAMIQVACLLGAREGPSAIDPGLVATPTVVTIHNAGRGYRQEIADLEFAATLTGLPPTAVASCSMHQQFEPFLAAAFFGATMTTVSENHARELQETGVDCLADGLGHRLKSMGITLVGITNGIDLGARTLPPEISALRADKRVAREELLEVWRPERMTAAYPEVRCAGQLDADGPDEARPDAVVAYVGRVSWQKGIDHLAEAIGTLLSRQAGLKLAVLGSGDPETEKSLSALAEAWPGRVAFASGYSEGLGELIYTAADLFVLPSRYEPCGLADLVAQAHGALPVVHAVGGLVKVIDGQTGFAYRGGPEELAEAIQRAIGQLHRPDAWRRMQQAAVRAVHDRFSWTGVFADRYRPLYREAREHSKPTAPPRSTRRDRPSTRRSDAGRTKGRDASPAKAGENTP